MPTYEYICNHCDRRFEKQLHFFDDVDQVDCPNCHQQSRRIFSKPSIVFKGSGFYVTDSRKGKSKTK